MTKDMAKQLARKSIAYPHSNSLDEIIDKIYQDEEDKKEKLINELEKLKKGTKTYGENVAYGEAIDKAKEIL